MHTCQHHANADRRSTLNIPRGYATHRVRVMSEVLPPWHAIVTQLHTRAEDGRKKENRVPYLETSGCPGSDEGTLFRATTNRLL